MFEVRAFHHHHPPSYRADKHYRINGKIMSPHCVQGIICHSCINTKVLKPAQLRFQCQSAQLQCSFSVHYTWNTILQKEEVENRSLNRGLLTQPWSSPPQPFSQGKSKYKREYESHLPTMFIRNQGQNPNWGGTKRALVLFPRTLSQILKEECLKQGQFIGALWRRNKPSATDIRGGNGFWWPTFREMIKEHYQEEARTQQVHCAIIQSLDYFLRWIISLTFLS